MRHHSVVMATAMLTCLLLSATYVCGIDDRIVQSKLANSTNEFAFSLYKTISESVNDKNIFMSPASVSIALGMVYLGTRGETKTQMTSVMHLDAYNSSDETSLKEDFKKLLETLFGNPQNNYTLYIANRLFGQDGYNITGEFLEDIEAYFNSTLEALDFINNSTISRLHINDWVAAQTSGKINDLLQDGTITAVTKLVLVNAIYFKGLWSYPFDKEATKTETFHLSATEDTQIDMMHLKRKRLNYYNSSELGCQVVELPYVGNQASMLVLLPNDDRNLSFVESRLGSDSLDEMFSGLKSVNCRVSLPKFVIDQGVSLSGYLAAIGIADLFDAAKADLSGIDGSRKLFVSDVVHKALVEVNEEGTEAAAATGVVVNFRSIHEEPIDFRVDRPFSFLIVDKTTGCILFLGRFTRPSKKDVDANTTVETNTTAGFPETTPGQ